MSDERQDHMFTREEKKEWWDEGPWCDEPDYVVGIYKDYRYRIIRMGTSEHNSLIFGGYLCGYVQLPKDHKLPQTDDSLRIPIDCHGGITYNEMENDGHQWVGFDCAHAMDYVPSIDKSIEKFKKERAKDDRAQSIERIKKEFPQMEWVFQNTYRDMDYCVEQCENMIDQIIEIESTNQEPRCP